MDLNAIKAKLDALNNNGQEREKTDYSKIFWKPELGKQTLRVVPSHFDPSLLILLTCFSGCTFLLNFFAFSQSLLFFLFT